MKITKRKWKESRIGRALLILVAATVLVAAFFCLWWIGAFLGNWISWKEKVIPYEDAEMILKNRQFNGYLLNTDGEPECFFRTPLDWLVQDALCFDIDRDGEEELILLVWKHGSYGKYRPIWEKHNDIRLEQHVFIYRWEQEEGVRLKPVWMSSALGYEVTSISRGAHDSLTITARSGGSKCWGWQDFGLKYLKDSTEQEASFLCAGDNLVHLSLLRYEDNGYDCFYQAWKTKIEKADFATINQETVFVKDENLISDYPRFGTPVEVGDAIVSAGFDMVTLANNHILDQNMYGVNVTTGFYNETKIAYIGVNCDKENTDAEDCVKIIEINDIHVAMLNYTYGTNGLPLPKEQPYLVEQLSNRERMKEQLLYAKTRADAILVFVHWGDEYSSEVNENQKELCELFMDYGVTAVIGTHPHVLQPCEVLGEESSHPMLVYYSLGNLVGSQMQEGTKMGGLAEFTIQKSKEGEVTLKSYSLERITTFPHNQKEEKGVESRTFHTLETF